MATPASVDSNEVTNVSLSEHIARLTKAFDATLKLAKVVSEARGAGTLKPGKKIKLADGREVGVEDLQACATNVRNAMRGIPRIVNNERKAELERKRARHANRETKAQPPSQYTSDLVNFFNSTDLGKARDGRTRLQDHADMALFFKNGIGNLTFGVSLFNVWGNIYKLRHGTHEIVLDSAAQRAMSGALHDLMEKKRSIINSPECNSPDAVIREEALKARATAQADLERLQAHRIHNKDYMSILSFYRVKNSTADLSPYTEAVARMSVMTKELNSDYGSQVRESRAQAKSAAIPAPTRTVAPAAPMPAMPSLKAPPAMPSAPVPTVARGSSPVARRR